MTITGAESADSGSYRCEAVNLIGDSNSIITISVEGNLAFRVNVIIKAEV